MLAELDWLRETPPGFRASLNDLRRSLSTIAPELAEERLYGLSLTRLDINQLHQLSNVVNAYLDRHPPAGPLSRIAVGMIGAGTLSLLAPAIEGSALRHRLLAKVTIGEYGNAMQDAVDPGGFLRATSPDVVLIVPDYRMLGLDRPRFSAEDADAAVRGAASMMRTMIHGLSGAVSAVIVATIVPPSEPLFGSFDTVEAGTSYAMTIALNAQLVEWARKGDIVLLDTARIAAAVGVADWHDHEQWHSAKLPFNPDLTPLYADMVARTLAAIRGTTRKCLVLDLDHTLWGGVIGDDGLEGIVVGQGSAKGEAFLALQHQALALRSRGIVLAVCSKNDEQVARMPFKTHPDMAMREEHIAVFVANWIDKATNLRRIASTLNIGLDALVFLDDNPAEREQVRRELPMVAVPELPNDPAQYPRILSNAGYFEAIGFAQEDRERADSYKANLQRAEIAASSDMAGYLAELGMVMDIRPFDALNRTRIAQLINKSNQFNLTTRRYTEKEVAALEGDPNVLTLQLRLDDRFGSNGMISAIIVHVKTWEIDTWLMSCRVLGRRVEDAALAHLAVLAKQYGAQRLIGRYIPTAKNAMVADHYEKLGFTLIERRQDGESLWQLDLAAYVPPSLPIRIEMARSGRP